MKDTLLFEWKKDFCCGERPSNTAVKGPLSFALCEANAIFFLLFFSPNLRICGYVGECVWYCKGRFYEVNGIANCCKGHAYEWETSIHLAGGLERDVGHNGEIELRPRSVAVFGKNTVYTLGHVVFIEEVDGENIAYSHCNCTKIGGIIRISNGEIEVPNPIVPLNKAQDGAKLYSNKNDFPTLFGSGLKAIIYKKPEET